MASDLLSIGASAARAAKVALDVTGQNIANASTDGYIRRSTKMAEVASTGYQGAIHEVSLSGVRISGVVRNADAFRQSEVRRTGSDTARAQTEVDSLASVEAAVENANVYTAITGFESALQRLRQDTTDTSLRASVVEAARTMTDTFQIASQQLDSVANGLRFNAADGITQVNRMAAELARTNLRLTRAADASSDQTTLLDQRDNLLQQISQYANITTTFATDGSVVVNVGGASGPVLVSGGDAHTLTGSDPGDGTLAYAIGADPVTLSGGSLAGQQQALAKTLQIHADLDDLAGDIVTTVNDAQITGADLDGAAGAALLSGSDAGSIALATSDPRKLATAALGSPPNSRDATNFNAMRSSIATANPAGRMDAILFDISATVSGRTITRDALKTISDAAATALSAQSGVDLDTEAVNLVRYQQAFQASGRVMQVAQTLFDTLLNIR